MTRILTAALAFVLLATSAAAEEPVAIGDGPQALPGGVHTRVAATRPRGFALRLGTGYGFTESIDGAPGPHHRVASSLGVSGQLLPWLAAAVVLAGHGDFHPDDGLGRDRGFVGAGSFELRATPRVADGLFAGVAVAALVHGGDAPSLDPSATSLEATGLFTVARRSFTFGVEAGYRLDRSATAIPAGVQFRPGDRLALGASAFDAVLVRVAANRRWGRFDAFGEVAFDALVGRRAPPLGESPLRIVAGARVRPTDAWQVELAVDACASSRGALDVGTPAVPVPPRFGVLASATYRFAAASGVADVATGDATDGPSDGGGADEAQAVGANDDPSNPAVGGAPRGSVLEGRILDAAGAPLVDARLEAEIDGARVEAYTDGEGRFRMVVDGTPDTTLVVTAHGHETARVAVLRGVVELPEAGLQLADAAPRGVVRGEVRDYDGSAVRASLRIMPGGRRVEVGDAGTFELELPPGRHELTIEAEGFTSQHRRVVVADGEVTILHIDLRRAR